ncbi:MAG: SCO family protein [Bacteroidia bacterium]|nr:SCO family protein [Bacteroidia bacterium]
MKKITISLLIVLGFGVIAYSIYNNKSNKKPLRYLPIYGNYTIVNTDTIYHRVPDFSFTDQLGKVVTQNNFKNKIYVTDFFFVTCKTICPIMTDNMESVYNEFKNDTNILFLSHTVNPEDDSVQVLKEYAEQHHANNNRWYFVTGNKKELYNQARKGYYLEANEGDGGEDDFIHTQNFALIDPNKNIRGYYDGTKENDIKKLLSEINLLKKEFGLK